MKSRLFPLVFCLFIFCALSSYAAQNWSGTKTDETLQATDTNNKKIVLTGNTTITNLYILDSDIEIDLNGYTLTVEKFFLGQKPVGMSSSNFNATITIKDSSTENTGLLKIAQYDVSNTATTSLTLDDANVKVTGNYYVDGSTSSTSAPSTITGTGIFDVSEASTTSGFPSIETVTSSTITLVTSDGASVKVYYWKGASGGEWTESTNWAANAALTIAVSAGTYPGCNDGDTAVFPSAGAGVNNLSLAGADYSLTLKTPSFFGYNSTTRITIVQTGDNADTANITIINGWFLFDSCLFGNVTVEENSHINVTAYSKLLASNYAMEAKSLTVKENGEVYGGSTNTLYVSESVENNGKIVGQFDGIFEGTVNNTATGNIGFTSVTFNDSVTNNGIITCGTGATTFNGDFTAGAESQFTASSNKTMFEGNADFSAMTATNFKHNSGKVYLFSAGTEKTFKTCASQSFNELYFGGNVKIDKTAGTFSVSTIAMDAPSTTDAASLSSFLSKITGGGTFTAGTDGLTLSRISSGDGVIGTLELDVNYSGALSMNEGTALVVDSSRTLSPSSFSSAGSSDYSCAIAVLGDLNASGKALTLPFTDVYCSGTIKAASIALTGANATTPTYIAGNLSSANTTGSATDATGHRFYNKGTVNVTGAITGTADITNTNSFTTNGVIANSINNSGTIFKSTGNISATTTITNSKTITLNNLSPASVELKMSAASIENSDLIYFQSGNTTLSFGSYTGNGSDKIVSAGGKIESTSATSATIGNLNASGTTSCEGLSELIVDSEFNTAYGFTVTGGSLTVNGTAYLGYSGNVTTTGSQKYKGSTSLNSTVESTVKLTSNGNIDFADVEISSGNTLSFGGTGYNVTVSGDWTNNGELTANQSTVTFTDTATISGDTTFYNLTLDAGGKTLTVSDAQSVSGTLTLKGQALGSLLSLSGSGHFVADTEKFSGEYLSIGSDIEIWKTGATAAVSGLFAVSNSEATVSSDSETVFSHGWKIGDMAFVWIGAVSTAWETAGNWRPAIVPGATGSEGVDVSIPDGVASGNYPVAAVSYSLKTLSVGSSTATTHNATLTLSGANNINITGATSPLVNYGTIVYQSSGRLTDGTNAINDTAHDGTIKYTGTSQTIAAVDYANLIVSGTAKAVNAITVLGDCAILGSADFQKSLDVSGTLSLSGTGPNQFNSSGGAITSTIASFECAMTEGGSVQIGSVGDTSSTFKVTSSTLSLPSALSSTIIGGTVDCASQTYNCPITLTGQPTTFKGTTVTFAGAVSSNSTGLSYGLKVDGNAVFKADVTSSGDIEVTGTTKTQGTSVTLDAKGAGLTNGKMTLSGAVVLGATSTTLKSIDDMTFGSTIEGASAKANAVTISAKTAVLGTAKQITITGAVGSSVPLGAVSVAGGTLSAGGNFAAKSLSIASGSTFKPATSSTVTLSGNFTNSGTFTHNNSTVVFSDTAVISGSTTFYDLKATTGGKTLSVSDTQTVLNTLSLKGAEGNLLGISGSGTLVCSKDNFSAEYLTVGGEIKIAENASSVVAGAFTAENSVPLVGVSVSAVFSNGWKLSNALAILETIAPVGSNKIAVMFNSMLYNDTGSLLTKNSDLSALESEISIEAANSETYDVKNATLVANGENSAIILLEISSRITLDDVKEGFIVVNTTSTAIFGEGSRTLSEGTKHCVSHFVAGAVEVLYAKADNASFDADAYTAREFTQDAGKEGRIFFSDEDGYKITVATHIATKADANGNLDFTGDFDDSLLLFAKKSTVQSCDTALFKNARGIKGKVAGASYLRNFSLDFSSGDLATCASGDAVEFMFALASNDGSLFKRSVDGKTDISLPVVRLADASDIRKIDTWRFTLSSIKTQRGGVTILNNVINSRAKEKTTIVVDTEKSTALKVYVMTMDGSIVRTLEKSRVKSGRHTYTWDGTNGAGKSVARGMYFVRVIGDDIDETRKVMVVKE